MQGTFIIIASAAVLAACGNGRTTSVPASKAMVTAPNELPTKNKDAMIDGERAGELAMQHATVVDGLAFPAGMRRYVHEQTSYYLVVWTPPPSAGFFDYMAQVEKGSGQIRSSQSRSHTDRKSPYLVWVTDQGSMHYHLHLVERNSGRVSQTIPLRNGEDPMVDGVVRIEEHAERVELRVIGGRKDDQVWEKVWRLDPSTGRFEFVE